MIQQQLVFIFLLRPALQKPTKYHMGDSLLIQVHTSHLWDLIVVVERFFQKQKWKTAPPPRKSALLKTGHYTPFLPNKIGYWGGLNMDIDPWVLQYKAGGEQVLSKCLTHLSQLVSYGAQSQGWKDQGSLADVNQMMPLL